jgi:phage FluMu protein gp41
MQTEKGMLPTGIEHGGAIHRAFEMRPRKVRDSIEAMEDPRARDNDSYMGLAILSGQMLSLGDIPKDQITTELLMELYETDLAELYAAAGRLEKRQQSFRGPGISAPQGSAESPQAGV